MGRDAISLLIRRLSIRGALLDEPEHYVLLCLEIDWIEKQALIMKQRVAGEEVGG